jgi:Na+/H+-dicarboxylate symporter/ABC-type amino acid transport substrate-binding protein
MEQLQERRNMLRRIADLPFGVKSMIGVVLGIIAARVVPEYCATWDIVGTIFIRASQLVTMPFIMLELACSLGELSNASLRTLLRTGGAVLLCLIAAAGMAVLLVPTWLPAITASSFFHPAILETPAPVSLLEKLLPFNIFTAMAADNFPAVVLFSAIAGIVLQGLPDNRGLLDPMLRALDVFRRLNKLVVRFTPIAVFALVSSTLAAADAKELVRLHALPVMGISGAVLLSVFAISMSMSVTTLTWRELWSIMKAPLILTASTANLIIALPTLVASLQDVLTKKFSDKDPGVVESCREQIGAAVPVGFALPTLGQVYMLMMVPFMGWYVSRPFDMVQELRMLATGIPGALGGIRSVIRQELAAASLPENLINVLFLNTEWVYRTEKTVSLIGLVVLALIIAAATTKTLRLRPRRFMTSLGVTLALGVFLTVGVNALLTKTLSGTYNLDQVLRDRAPMVSAIVPFARIDRVASTAEATLTMFPSLPVQLDSIRARGVLRVGIKSGDYPWAFRNGNNQLVGYDVDVMQTAANFSGLSMQIVEAPLEVLELMLHQKQLDLAIGGIEANAYRSARMQNTSGYQTVHKSLVVWPERLADVQNAERNLLQRPLRIAVAETYLPSPDQQDRIEEFLGSPGPPAPVVFTRIASTASFYSGSNRSTYDAMLVSAEGGSSWSVMYPESKVLTPFGNELPTQMVMLLGGNDPAWLRYMDGWLAMQANQRLFAKLYDHWITVTH